MDPFTIEQRFDRLEALIAKQALSQKRVLTFDEGCVYTGRSESDLYKKTSLGLIPHSKPNGKMIYFDREKLDVWMLGNPIKTAAQTATEAANYVIKKTKAA
jgi:hypothetical protein